LDVGNVRLDNYQARTNYFPIKYREGAAPPRNFPLNINSVKDNPALLIWERNGANVPREFRSIFKNRKLEIFIRDDK
jgi:hypothetical protein